MQWLAVVVGCLLTVGAAALNADGCDDSMCKYGKAYRDKGELCKCTLCSGDDEITLPSGSCQVCSTVFHCNDHASDVKVASDRRHCQCACEGEWAGDECFDCPSQFHKDGKACGDRCSNIATGSPPNCVLCDMARCNGNAKTNPTIVGNKCVCECKKFFKGDTCNSCMEGYEGGDCGQCIVGWIEGVVPIYGNGCVDCNTQPGFEQGCGGRASSVTSDRKSCKCVGCKEGLTGTMCDECAQGWIEGIRGAPDCEKCDNNKACNGRAKSITTKNNKCVCSCNAGYEGAACDVCSAGYIGDGAGGECTKCTSSKHCSNHASSVTSTGARTECTCTCSGQWTGTTCDNCPAPYTGSSCNQCNANSINYPTCTECTIDVCASGSQTATSVKADSSRRNCICECKAPFEGSKCDKCAAGYFGTAPNCEKCTLTTLPCYSGKATGVVSTSSRDTCKCTCKSGYTGDKCDQCKSGYYGFPNCQKCTSEDHCFDHASRVVTNADQTGCVCKTCRNSWTESSNCKDCPPEYDPTPDCNRCKAGFVGFPNCKECTNVDHCNGFATKVETNSARSGCVCTCQPQYEGSRCERCADGYVGDYPTCIKCDLGICNGRADSVMSSSDRKKCICDCRNQYEGDLCESCAEGYVGEAAVSCDKCTSATHCNGRAKNSYIPSSASRTTCLCECENHWLPSDGCKTCDSKYTGPDCNGCAEPETVLPSCTKCSVEEHCNGHATAVAYNSGSCSCTCRGNWYGDDCDQCPSGLFKALDCEECNASTQCSGNALRAEVVGDKCVCRGTWDCENYAHPFSDSACTCKSVDNKNKCPCGKVGCTYYGNCNNMWRGAKCNQCDRAVYTGDDCNGCQSGRWGYPWCFKCDDHWDRWGCNSERTEAAIPDSDARKCHCQCKAQFEGAPDCNECAYGYIHTNAYNESIACGQCKNDVDCGGNAMHVGSNHNRTECTCQCKPGYEDGPNGKCMHCVEGWYNDGPVAYPYCVACTNQDHCSNHAISVTDDGMRTGCKCTCLGQWASSTNKWGVELQCSYCDASKYNPATCDECVPGRIAYPNCYECNVDTHCHGHAVAVKPDDAQLRCKCECRNQWGGAGGTCRFCESPYGGADCNECESPTADYNDMCGEKCTVKANCSNNAFVVHYDNTTSTCNCDCRNHYEGAMCNECNPPYGGTDCDGCGAGFAPKDGECVACTVDAYCNGRAQKARATLEGCVCDVCKDPSTNVEWLGEHCETCPDKYDKTCTRCAEGTFGFPDCMTCDTTAGQCREDRTKSAVVLAEGTKCGCECLPRFEGDTCASGCSNKWEGDDCEVCPSHYAGENCNTCAPGYRSYPDCHLCSVSDCPGGMADEVTSDGQYCECVCFSRGCGDYGRCFLPGPDRVYTPKEAEAGYPREGGSRTETATLTETLTETVSGSETPTETLMCSRVSYTKTRTLTETLVDEDAQAAALPIADDEASFPWWVLLIVLLLCCSCIAAALMWRRKKQEEEDKKICPANESNNVMVPLTAMKPSADEAGFYDPEPVREESVGEAPESDESCGGDDDEADPLAGAPESKEDPFAKEDAPSEADSDRMDV